jgi:hypothetical protein
MSDRKRTRRLSKKQQFWVYMTMIPSLFAVMLFLAVPEEGIQMSRIGFIMITSFGIISFFFALIYASPFIIIQIEKNYESVLGKCESCAHGHWRQIETGIHGEKSPVWVRSELRCWPCRLMKRKWYRTRQ